LTTAVFIAEWKLTIGDFIAVSTGSDDQPCLQIAARDVLIQRL
jgi:hypothetical protein